MTYIQDFKKYWIPIYAEQYKNSNLDQKMVIKNNVFRNIHFSEKEKEKIWNEIIRKSGYLK